MQLRDAHVYNIPAIVDFDDAQLSGSAACVGLFVRKYVPTGVFLSFGQIRFFNQAFGHVMYTQSYA